MWAAYALTAFMPFGLWIHTRFYYELAGVAAPAATVAAVCAGTSLTYVFDRVVEPPSDTATSSVHHKAMRSKTFSYGFLAACAFVCAGTMDARAARTAALCALLCVWYSVPLPGVRLRIKELFPLSKTAFVPTLHVLWPFGCAGAWPPFATALALWFSVAASTVYMDVKDIAVDRREGVVTLPTLLGHAGSLRALAALYAFAAVVALPAFANPHGAALACSYALHAAAMARYAATHATPTIRFCNVSWCVPWLLTRVVGAA